MARVKATRKVNAKAAANPYGVMVGDVWEDCDPRFAALPSGPRRVKIVSVTNDRAEVVVEQTGRRAKIRLDRFRPTATGYRCVVSARGSGVVAGKA